MVEILRHSKPKGRETDENKHQPKAARQSSTLLERSFITLCRAVIIRAAHQPDDIADHADGIVIGEQGNHLPFLLV